MYEMLEWKDNQPTSVDVLELEHGMKVRLECMITVTWLCDPLNTNLAAVALITEISNK